MAGAVDGFMIDLEGGLDAAAAAREAVREHGSELTDAVLEDVLLMVTELVTNAVRHGQAGSGGSVRLECRTGDEHLRYLVTEAGAAGLRNGVPTGPAWRGTNGDVSGWGLLLVEQIAERWGILAGSPGTCVWFEVAA